MKESNGVVQQPMATSPEPTEEIVSDEINHIAAVNAAIPEGEHEFSLAIKPKGTPLFKVSALYKKRLKICIFLHCCLFVLMLCKLSEAILDNFLDIFILQLEELYIPEPLAWEWIWTSSILTAFIGLKALSKNSFKMLISYAASVFMLSICPLIGAAIYFFNDLLEYADKKGEAAVEFYKGYPVALYVWGFAILAVQVDIFSIYFVVKLLKIWKIKMKRF